MQENQTIEAIVCKGCGGEPRLSAQCKLCGGAGIGVAGTDGFLVWEERVDEFMIALRKARRQINAFFHLGLLAVVLVFLVLFAWQANRLEDLGELQTLAFWVSGYWYVTLFWFACFFGTFLVFRLSEYSVESKALPNWGKTHRQLEHEEKIAEKKAGFRFDVAPYFSVTARDVVESAYNLAKKLQRTEVTPQTLFAAALASPSGGVFMVRLGMQFDKVKEPITNVLLADDAGNPPVHLSRDAKKVLALAYADARANQRRHVEVMEIFLQAFKNSPKIQDVLDQLGFPPEHVVHVGEWIRLRSKLKEDHDRFQALAALKPKSTMNRAMTAQQTSLLDRFSEDLTLMARNGYIAPAVGRQKELAEMLRGIESGRRSLVLVGEPGSGKTALVEELARMMVEENVPPELFDRRLVSVNIAQVVAAGDPGMAAERFLSLMHEVGVSGNIVLVMNNIESLTGAGLGGPMDLAEMLASELDKGYLLAICTTTPQAWTRYIERRSLANKLIKINIPETDYEDTIKVLMARSGLIEYDNKVFFSYAALDKAAALSERFVHEKASPERALDIIREAAVLARKSRGKKTFVTADDVAKVVHEKTNIPVESMTTSEASKLMNLEQKLHERVIGQEEAVQAVSRALKRSRAELREGKRPIANFLFLGPTGVGKTELTKALAAEYFGSEEAMVRLDMSEYQDKASVYRVIGAPGDDRGGLLTEAVRNKPYTIVLLDELEKAHPDILTLFLQVMDDGRLTDGVGRTVDFTNVMLIATSNAGTPFIQAEVTKNTPLEQIKRGLLENELKGIFRPEFLNRFDGVIVFRPLTMDDVTQIAWLMINGITRRLAEKGMNFRAEDSAVEELAKEGFDPLYGARPLRRVIQEKVDTALADLMLQGKVGRKDTLILEPGGNIRVEKAPEL
ncbi:MAG: ATP-dependent Clp protease ATP-binding subunit [Patescibacteria group bacterium]|nr:ATP-dependent Clp protease ATP-binding subunit [Patescibacteria group bacterium]